MKRQNMMRYLIVALLTVVCAVFCLAACKSEEEYKVTWDIDSHAEVKVEGYDSLPETAKKGATLTFTVTGKDGYTVDEVLRNGTTNINATNGKYTLNISADVSIKVTTKEEVDKVEVTAKPTKLTYFAGESLDKTGMEVTVSYKTGNSEKLSDNQYRVVYASATSASTFAVGEDSFKVSYDGVESAAVALDSKVKGLVTVDLHGATLDETYLNGLKANTELADVKVEDGKLTFTFAEPLKQGIALPVGSQLSMGGEAGDYVFLGWTIDGTVAIEIAAGTKTSVTVTSQWESKLVEFTHISLEMKGDLPMLVIEGTFHAAQEVYLWLYEGNDKVDLTGPSIKGSRGETFKLEYNLQELSADEYNGKYKGKWMDIKVRAARGDVIDEQEINLENFPEDFVDLEQTVHDSRYEYNFQVHTPDGTTQRNLKVQYVDYTAAVYDYKITSEVKDGVGYVIFSGKVFDSAYYGNYVQIDFDIGGKTYAYGLIGSDGSYECKFELTEDAGFKINTSGYAHIHIVKSEEDQTVVWQGGTTDDSINLKNQYGNNEGLSMDYVGVDLISGYALRIEIGDDAGTVWYVGKGKWGGVVCYGRTEGKYVQYNTKYDVALKVDSMTNPTKVYYVFYVEVKGYGEDYLKTLQFGNIDTNNNTKDLYANEKVEKVQEGLYRLWFDVTEYAGSQLWPNVYAADDTKLFEIKEDDGSANGLYAIVGEKRYEIAWSTDFPYWNGPCMIFGTDATGSNPESADPDKWETVTPEPGPEPEVPTLPDDATYAATGIDLVSKDGKAYLVISGTYENCTEAEIKAYLEKIYVDMQHNQQAGGSSWNREKTLPRTVTVTADGWKLELDITDLTDVAYTAHFDSTDGVGGEDNNTKDLNIADTTNDGKSVTVGTKTFTLVNKPGSSEATEFWGHIGVKIVTENAPTFEIDFTTAKLVVEDNRVYLTVSGTCANCTEEDFLMDLQRDSGDWGYYPAEKGGHPTVEIKDGSFTVKFDITDADPTEYLAHLYIDGRINDFEDKSGTFKEISVTAGGKTYTLKITSMWDRNMLTITIA